MSFLITNKIRLLRGVIWKRFKCRCDTCLSKNFIGIVPPHCEWYRDNVTFGGKSPDECPYYKSIEK